jgi:hypothetical protein
LVGREGRVEGDGLEGTEVVRELVGFNHDFSAGVFDFLFTRQENEDVSFSFCLMDHEDGTDGGFEVVGFGLGGVEAVKRKKGKLPFLGRKEERERERRTSRQQTSYRGP